MTAPGPVSDSYDPEFSTGANAHDVRKALEEIVDGIAVHLGPQLKDIVSVVQGARGAPFGIRFRERDLRVICFGLNRALESL